MIALHGLKWFVPALMILPFVLSCAQMKGPPSKRTPAEVPSPPVEETSPTSAETSARAVQLAKAQMDAGAYQQAMDIYRAACRSFPEDRAFLKAYRLGIERIKSAADVALAKKDYVTAGRNYDALLRNRQEFERFGNQLSFTGDYLNAQLATCKTMISRQGFEQYRKGNLSRAIELWQSLLDIDPHDASIRVALETAKLQLKNLQGENGNP